MFKFQEPGPLVDADLELILTDIYSGNTSLQRVPVYQFDMTLTRQGVIIGKIDLRVGNTPHILNYGGHIGYEVTPAQRGHHYAARSVRLLLPLARSHGLDTLWITCNPDNWASRRTCELAGFVFVEIVDLPEHSEMSEEDAQQKCRYRLKL
jgi:tagatose 1,6-diphosphate aldolase